MYKIIVVDDEDDVRRGIIGSVPWEEHGFIVAGEAENGKEALEMCEREMPDVIIADINMPYINGIELLEALDEKRPRPEVIFLTAYDEFEYAQKAVSLKATEYILKPVTGDELKSLLKKLKKTMDEEAAKREDIELLRSEFEKHLPILREKFISLLINGKLSQDDIEQKINAYGMETFRGRTFLAGIVMIDGETEDEAIGFDVKEHRELIQFAVYNIANEIMETHRAGITFLYGDTVILISIGDDEESLVPKSLSIFYEIGESIKKYLKFTATIGAGYYCSSIQDIKRSYNSAVTACNYRMLLGGDKVIYIADIEPQGQYKTSSEEDAVQALVNSIRSASWPETSAQIDRIFNNAASRLFSPDEYMPYIFEIVTVILRTANTLGISTPALLGSDIGQLIGLAGNSNLAEIKLWVKRICEKVINEINEGRQSFKKKVIKDSKQYIREHYADPDAGIETVCRQMHISQSYFCSIFKKEMNDTFSNYLHVYRMQAAKELLRTTDLKLSDVAERIGYTDPNYFSFSFKKTFGISPREYRAL